MAYRLEKFGSTLLPTAQAVSDNHAAPAVSLVRNLPGGGIYDYYGTSAAPLEGQRLKVKGMLYAATAAARKTAFQNLRARVGEYDTLYRLWDDGSTRETIPARLLKCNSSRSYEDANVFPVDLEFQTLADHWDGVAVTNSMTTVNLTSAGASAHTPTLANNGDADVKDIVLTIDVNSGELTRVDVVITSIAAAVWFYWSGSATSNDQLVIDCGKQSITLDGADEYDNFAYIGTPSISEWAIIEANDSASSTITFTTTTAVNVDMDITYNHAWK